MNGERPRKWIGLNNTGSLSAGAKKKRKGFYNFALF
jgi:hypothetical protein